MENLNEALSLLVVGMIMVFLILFLVVFVGNVVIYITNRYLREEQKKVKEGVALKGANPKKIAVLAAAVDHITQGKGRIDKIQKK